MSSWRMEKDDDDAAAPRRPKTFRNSLSVIYKETAVGDIFSVQFPTNINYWQRERKTFIQVTQSWIWQLLNMKESVISQYLERKIYRFLERSESELTSSLNLDQTYYTRLLWAFSKNLKSSNLEAVWSWNLRWTLDQKGRSVYNELTCWPFISLWVKGFDLLSDSFITVLPTVGLSLSQSFEGIKTVILLKVISKKFAIFLVFL